MLAARRTGPCAAAATRSAGAVKPRSAVVVAARPTRASELRGLDNAELLQRVSTLKRESMRLEYMQRTRGNTINPGAVSKTRRKSFYL
jgi:ribosomal protein L29